MGEDFFPDAPVIVPTILPTQKEPVGHPVLLRESSQFSGRNFVIPVDTAGIIDGTLMYFEAPTLIRAEAILDGVSGTGFLQNVNGSFVLQLRAELREFFSNDINVKRQQYHRAQGPYLWLPAPGFYMMTARTGGNVGVGTPLQCTAFVGIQPQIAREMMSGTTPFSYYSETLVLAAGVASPIPSPAALATFVNFNWFGMMHLFVSNTLAVNPFTFRTGGIATAVAGQIVPAGLGNSLTRNWQQLAGINASAFSTAGTTIYVEGRSI